MSILIKGMEMPKDGNFVELLIWSDGHVTKTGDSYIAEDGRAYYQPCSFEYFQAIPVPPHGRLVDADKLADSFEPSDFWNPEAVDNCYAAVRIVHSAPTIIMAEEAEE